MALRRVRSKSEPKFESVVSDEWLERFPDDFHVLDNGDPVPGPVAPSKSQSPSTRVPTYVEDDSDSGYR